MAAIRKTRTRRRDGEHEQQVGLFQRIAFTANQYAPLRLVYAVPNGGERHLFVAQKLKAEGVKAGVPDIHWPWPSQEHHGLWIEMKFGKNKPTQKQEWWLNELSNAGHFTSVCWSWKEAWDVICDYDSNVPND